MVLNTETVAQKCSIKKVFLQILQNSQENKVEACNFVKAETLAQVFSRELWEIWKKTFFIEHRRWLLPSIRLGTTKIVFAITIQMTMQHFLFQRSKYSTK